MNRIITLSVLLLAGIISFTSCGGGGSSSSNQPSALTLKMDSAYNAQWNFKDLLNDEIVKKYIVEHYGQELYDILDRLSYIEDGHLEINENGYEFNAIGNENTRNHVVLNYLRDEEYLILDVCCRGNKFYDGKFTFNTQGWELSYLKDEWGEDDKSKPYIWYVQLGSNPNEAGYGKNADLACYVFKVNDSYIVKLLTSYADGTVYQIDYKTSNGHEGSFSYGEPFREEGQIVGAYNHGIYFSGIDAWNFIRGWGGYDDYMIAFRASKLDYVVKNPKNFNNIENAFYEYLADDKEKFTEIYTDHYVSYFSAD